jgi:hypothetical protein
MTVARQCAALLANEQLLRPAPSPSTLPPEKWIASSFLLAMTNLQIIVSLKPQTEIFEYINKIKHLTRLIAR